MDNRIQVGDILSIAGVFRNGTMDESRQYVTDNVQVWRAAAPGGTVLEPVLQNGDPDVESFWFGRMNGIAIDPARLPT